ncbi:hypothetical protein BXZ70DRAFT_1009757 [Cristinia sonorae]|uniref:Uncharacterized protein n=1 Tax=Cristinia sonorae TaxID=1940300 RepID=A0A8K0ULZ8_9AGAR|nr:hypothetical protein BXZ70DRAFT_1009757 [Cristinia sonorae]
MSPRGDLPIVGSSLSKTASITELYAVRDGLQRVIQDLTRVQERHELAIKKAEMEGLESRTRLGRLEEQVASLVLEVQELKLEKNQTSSKRRATASSSKTTVNERLDGGSPGRRTEPRKLMLASPPSNHSSSPDQRKVPMAMTDLMSHTSSALPEPDRGGSPEPKEQARPLRRAAKGKGKERMTTVNVPDDPEESDAVSVHVKSRHSTARKSMTPTKRTEGAGPASSSRLSKGKERALSPPQQPFQPDGQQPDTDSDGDMQTASESSETDDSGDEWRVWQFVGEGSPKAGLAQAEGPLDRDELEECLGLNKDALEDIDRLIMVKKPRFRFSVFENIAFVYDPHMLESGPDTLLVSWGTPKYNHFARELLKDHFGVYGSCLHTFVFPRQQYHDGNPGWWYLGYLQWREFNDAPLWPLLRNPVLRHTLTTTLAKSWDCMDADDIAENLGNGLLVQYNIHISRPNNFHEETKQFIEVDLRGHAREDDGLR